MMGRMKEKDVFIKIAAFVLAAIVWVQVVNDQNPMETRSIGLPIHFSMAEDRVLMSASAEKVSLTLEGRAHTLNTLFADKPEIVLELYGTEPGEDTLPIVFDPPRGVVLLDMEPSQVTVDQDVLERKAVTVNIQPKGVPHEDYEVGKPLCSLDKVEITGPKRQLDKVAWAVGEIDVAGASAEVGGFVPLFPKDSFNNTLSKITVNPKEVEVRIPLVSRPPAKVVQVRVDVRGVPKTGYRLETQRPDPQFVRIRAPEDVLSRVDALTLGPIDVGGRDSSFVFTGTLNIPPGVSWVETPEVRATLSIVEDVVEKRFEGIIVTPKEPRPGLKFAVSPGRVDIVLSGRRDIISALKPSDIEAYVDARDRAVGDYRLRVALVLPHNLDVSIADIDPMYVTLMLEER